MLKSCYENYQLEYILLISFICKLIEKPGILIHNIVRIFTAFNKIKHITNGLPFIMTFKKQKKRKYISKIYKNIIKLYYILALNIFQYYIKCKKYNFTKYFWYIFETVNDPIYSKLNKFNKKCSQYGHLVTLLNGFLYIFLDFWPTFFL